ncbi:2-dehydro-3-deoxygalactonokinase [Nitratireductor luteus]|uniref:2-dehydro-3-deoxygalactonokinase n=1 Tax=Nitratireductor luteus TaxID=2976980 RepID=UPI002240BB2A|nr:2-dehydro-3-deoxygalactonokinase [Nitratireductor luteus]
MSGAEPQAFCAAIDWGTTNMRLWLLGGEGSVIAQRASGEGMRACMPDRFEAVMETHLSVVGAPDDLPVIVSGMAGARGGWAEAPYLDAPADLRDLGRNALRVVSARRDVRILPGVCQRMAGREDVMRGEETQLAGAMATGTGSGLFCLPGTHSKWARLEEGRLTGFTTFMTGELYALMRQHSILRDTLGEGDADPGNPAFGDAVREMLSGDAVTAALFSLRAAALLSGTAPEELRARLSGLLLGSEIAAAIRQERPDEVQLVAAGGQARLYETAFEAAGIAGRTLDGAELVRRGLFDAACILWPERIAP